MFFLPGRAVVSSQRFSFSRVFPVALSLLLLTASAVAQSGVDPTGTGGRHTIQGRIYFPSGRRADAPIKVRLESTHSGALSVFADTNGSFRFTSLSPGTYTVLVEAGDEYEPVRETVYIDENRSRETRTRSGTAPRIFTVPIHLQPKRSGSRVPKPGTVDAGLAGVPEAARELYHQALEAARGGDSKTAIEHLKGALALHPEFPLALNELGVQYLKSGQPDKAVEPLRSAVKLAPDAFMPRLNYGIALVQQREFAEAEKELRQALTRNESSPVAHLYLGIALISLRNYDESERELQQAVSSGREDISMGHYYLGGLYWRKREYKRAADELETYLKLAPQAANADRVRDTIRDLRSKQ